MKRVLVDWTLAGSSPRGRGKPVDVVTHALVLGLIPARAGKTAWAAAVITWP